MTAQPNPKYAEEVSEHLVALVDFFIVHNTDKSYVPKADNLEIKSATKQLLALIDKAEREAWLLGYEAGHDVGSGNLRGIDSEEIEKRILAKRPDIVKYRAALKPLNRKLSK